ncbi:iron-sulfur cluster assembly protein SufD [Klebsiella oxytoca]|nr:iron-sulfur cluster assembly protein SufD [Klebsiella oxytoca]
MPEDLLTRSVNVGFSGGEKKRNDILQMAVLEPELCILDESDSGLDIDALKIVSDGVNSLRDGKRSFIIVTHYQRILDYIKAGLRPRACTRGGLLNPAILLWSNNWRSRAMAGLPNSSNALQQWHHLFEAQSEQRSPQAHQHLQQLLRLGLPTRKHENWKYTPLDALLNHIFVAAEPQKLTAAQRDALGLAVDAWRLVFVDGQFNERLSDDLTASGFEVRVDNDRQPLPESRSARSFSAFDRKPGDQRHPYPGRAPPASGKAAADRAHDARAAGR